MITYDDRRPSPPLGTLDEEVFRLGVIGVLPDGRMRIVCAADAWPDTAEAKAIQARAELAALRSDFSRLSEALATYGRDQSATQEALDTRTIELVRERTARQAAEARIAELESVLATPQDTATSAAPALIVSPATEPPVIAPAAHSTPDVGDPRLVDPCPHCGAIGMPSAARWISASQRAGHITQCRRKQLDPLSPARTRAERTALQLAGYHADDEGEWVTNGVAP